MTYLSRYTHRVVIANSRLIAFNKNTVSFKYKDVDGPDRYKVMTLATDEFIRRFLIHVLPKGFTTSDTTACSPRLPAPTTSHALVSCSVAKGPKAKLQIPMIMMATTPRLASRSSFGRIVPSPPAPRQSIPEPRMSIMPGLCLFRETNREAARLSKPYVSEQCGSY